jgi:hypothetical protein
MVVVAILVIAAAVTIGGVRQDEFSGQYKRYVEDVSGAIIQARRLAIDDSTRTEVEVNKERLFLREWNNATNAWDNVAAHWVGEIDGGLLGDPDGAGPNIAGVCIRGFHSGVMAPKEGTKAPPPPLPSSCLTQTQRIWFQPDGTFTDPDNSIGITDGAGVTLWVSDQRVPSKVRHSLIQVYPGGLIRTFHDVQK